MANALDQYLDLIGTNRNAFAVENNITPSTLSNIVARDTPVDNYKAGLLKQLATAGKMTEGQTHSILSRLENGEKVSLTDSDTAIARSYHFGEIYGTLFAVSGPKSELGKQMMIKIEEFATAPATWVKLWYQKYTRDYKALPHNADLMAAMDALGAGGMTDEPLGPTWLSGSAWVQVRYHDGENAHPAPAYAAIKGGSIMSDTAKFYFHGLYVGRIEQVDGKWMIYTSKQPNVDEDELDYGEDTKEDTAAAFQDELESRGEGFDGEEDMDGYDADEGFKILG